MTFTFKTLIVVATLGLGACTNPDGGMFGNGGGTGGGGATVGVEDAANPSSPAYFSQTVGDRVLFVVDQSTLTENARLTLVAQANWLKANPEYAAIIEGHADEQGTREYNLALGARRASAVQNFLISQGVSGGRLKTLTYGKERPIELCSEETCYAKNRRSVTVISAGPGV
jgi:peptidoglycan-associated lipoprotein